MKVHILGEQVNVVRKKKHFRLRLRLSVVKIYEKSPVSLNMIHYVSNAYLNFVPWLLSLFLEFKPEDTVWHNVTCEQWPLIIEIMFLKQGIALLLCSVS